MNEPTANNTRAALEVARVALGRMTGAPPAAGAPRTVPMTMASRASEAWKSAEVLLRLLTARPDLAGQALLAEARRVDKLDMEGMHALVAMREWVERTLAPGSAAQMLTLPPTDAEREVAVNALAALDRSMGIVSPGVDAVALSSIPEQPSTTSTSQWAPQAASNAQVHTPKPQSTWAPPGQTSAQATASSNNASGVQGSGGAAGNANGWATASAGQPPQRSVSSGLIMALLLLVLVVGGGGAWFALRDKGSSSLTQEGVDAYTRGAKEAARISLAKAVLENPQDVRALTYLGRVSREQGDLATARRYLESAIRADPNNALALRELGSALLADNEYELSRRFYVRALKIDSTDKIAQGFLGCTLLHLKRTEEGLRWLTRAGTSGDPEWIRCAAAADPAALRPTSIPP